jgi:DNA-binding SARP family transcriptional activator
MTVLTLRLLGGFGLESSGVPLEMPFAIQRLLAFLALRGRSHRFVVAGTLWPDVPETQALGSLRTGVWRMNKLLPGLVHADGAALYLSDVTVVDSQEQERFATGLLREHRDDEGWLSSGMTFLWPGELLPGWYDDWIVFERDRLSQLRLHALEQSARVLIQRGQLVSALQLALEAVRAEPLRESATAVLMAVYLAEGNVVDAIHQYDAFRRQLKGELGLGPSPRLGQLLPPGSDSLLAVRDARS